MKPLNDTALQAAAGSVEFPIRGKVGLETAIRTYMAALDPVPTHRHRKRGGEYVLLGYGKMQTAAWREPMANTTTGSIPVDLHTVAIYRSVDDGSLWARPREEFEDGRFEPLPAAPMSQES